MSDDFSKQPGTGEHRAHRADEDILHDSNDGELLGDLLNEISAPDENAEAEPAITPADDAIALEVNDHASDEAPEEKKSSLLLSGIIVAALVGGIAYFTTTSDSPEQQQTVTASNKAVSPPATALQKPVTHEAAKALSTARETVKKVVEPVVASAKKVATTEKPVSLKPLLDQPEAVAKSSSTTASDETELSSTIAAILEVDPVTRKVISPPQGTTFAWAINLMSLSTHAAADRLIKKLKASGTTTELVQINIGENTFYRVRVPDFSSVEEADAAHAKFKEESIYQGSWVSRYHK
ncbi:SPOR domain-containing protein [Mariprofundus sp. KV]|uniref:SPOR domain-containing protein n=1 Tax=Mariprofundus sp. KV TaxID=2608715 RepID=UPI0015A32C65|nr:SPOR domain-containing protein [Mariprofundus sp. KV]NWF37383.1 hypothetical protein [Mariprofundus sp. KV]